MWFGFNINIVECKLFKFYVSNIESFSFNINIVECKWGNAKDYYENFNVLI